MANRSSNKQNPDKDKIPFDIDNPVLPEWVEENALTSEFYPYKESLPKSRYKKEMRALQLELIKLQVDVKANGRRLVILFEGRDAAGKGGSIARFNDNLNPRNTHVIALSKPTDLERDQWYFQRYLVHLPAKGHISLFDRSWYNRAGVEPVMGFCTDEQHQQFLQQVPEIEKLLVEDDIILVKFWLSIGQEMQLKRFHERRHNALKQWKLSPVDLKAMDKWDDYTKARNLMLEKTHTQYAPWTVILANCKLRGRLNLIRHVLHQIDYQDKDLDNIDELDPDIVLSGSDFIKRISNTNL